MSYHRLAAAPGGPWYAAQYRWVSQFTTEDSTRGAAERDTVTEGEAVDLHQQLYRFRQGHRIMVQVQSTWFPLYDRNPQTFVPNIFRATASDFRAQEHRIWHTSRYPSHLSVQTLP